MDQRYGRLTDNVRPHLPWALAQAVHIWLRCHQKLTWPARGRTVRAVGLTHLYHSASKTMRPVLARSTRLARWCGQSGSVRWGMADAERSRRRSEPSCRRRCDQAEKVVSSAQPSGVR